MKFKTHGSVHHNSLLIRIQPDATVCRYLFTAKSLYMFRMSQHQPDATVCKYLFTAKSFYMFRVSQHPSSGVLRTVTAASGTGHNIGSDQAMLEGSSCSSVITCTEGCGYSV